MTDWTGSQVDLKSWDHRYILPHLASFIVLYIYVCVYVYVYIFVCLLVFCEKALPNFADLTLDHPVLASHIIGIIGLYHHTHLDAPFNGKSVSFGCSKVNT